MARSTEVANLAVGHLAQGVEIANIDTDNTAAANACRRFYDTALRTVLRDFDWGFATKTRALSLITEDPNDEWLYSYSYPTDCLNFRRIQSGTRTDTESTKVRYRTVYGDNGTEIHTDKEDAIGEYTVLVEDYNRYPQDFVLAFSYMLAHLVAPRITGGDPHKLGEAALRNYMMAISKAQANSGNEDAMDPEPASELERSRL